MQELGWSSELRELLLKNSTGIEESGNIMMKSLRSKAIGNNKEYIELQKEMASSVKILKVVNEYEVLCES